MSAYAFFINGLLVSWAAKKQVFVSTLIMESEYVAAAQAAKEAIWLRFFLSELISKMTITIEGFDKGQPTRILCDNEAAIRVAKNSENHKQAKHIDINYHFLRQRVHLKQIELEYVSTKEMAADFLTKPLTPEKFTKCRDQMGLKAC